MAFESKFKRKIKEFLFKKYNISFSKSGEDLILAKILKRYKNGVFVDIGCWDPIDYSNTYYFSLRGFKGICIDPNPNLKNKFQRLRRNDLFVENGVASNASILEYYVIKKKSSLNTFNYDFIKQNNLIEDIEKVINIEVKPLSEILDQINFDGLPLLFFDVDVEGFDLEVLKSNNWEKYRPFIVMVESDTDLKSDVNSEMTIFLKEKGYDLVAKTSANQNLGNAIYLRQDFYSN